MPCCELPHRSPRGVACRQANPANNHERELSEETRALAYILTYTCSGTLSQRAHLSPTWTSAPQKL